MTQSFSFPPPDPSADQAAKNKRRTKERPPPPPEEEREVTLQDLAELPMRGAVAFAARCALRVQPHFNPPEDLPDRDQAFVVLAEAIRIASAFAQGSIGPFPHADRTARLVYNLGEFTFQYSQLAPYAAYHAAQAVVEATRAGEHANDASATEVVAAAYGASRVALTGGTGVRPNDQTLQVVIRALRADMNQLRELNLGQFRELGEPIDPSETGPLGPLWPEGEPVWF